MFKVRPTGEGHHSPHRVQGGTHSEDAILHARHARFDVGQPCNDLRCCDDIEGRPELHSARRVFGERVYGICSKISVLHNEKQRDLLKVWATPSDPVLAFLLGGWPDVLGARVRGLVEVVDRPRGVSLGARERLRERDRARRLPEGSGTSTTVSGTRDGVALRRVLVTEVALPRPRCVVGAGGAGRADGCTPPWLGESSSPVFSSTSSHLRCMMWQRSHAVFARMAFTDTVQGLPWHLMQVFTCMKAVSMVSARQKNYLPGVLSTLPAGRGTCHL